jgi:hypothetical protein
MFALEDLNLRLPSYELLILYLQYLNLASPFCVTFCLNLSSNALFIQFNYLNISYLNAYSTFHNPEVTSSNLVLATLKINHLRFFRKWFFLLCHLGASPFDYYSFHFLSQISLFLLLLFPLLTALLGLNRTFLKLHL